MAISRKASTTGHTFVQLVVLCLALASCKVKGKGGPHPPRGGAPADPGTIFNVLQFGAKFGQKEISTEVKVEHYIYHRVLAILLE